MYVITYDLLFILKYRLFVLVMCVVCLLCLISLFFRISCNAINIVNVIILDVTLYFRHLCSLILNLCFLCECCYLYRTVAVQQVAKYCWDVR